MRCVDGWSGFKGWHRFGSALGVENPGWLLKYGIDPTEIDPATNQYIGDFSKTTRVGLHDAIEIALVNNRDYQTRIEELYLAALDVTFERFQFAVRYLGFGRREPSLGIGINGATSSSSDSVSFFPRAGISQVLPFGGQWVVELANNTIWLFSGPNPSPSATTLSFQLVQPLLFGAGRQVVLEGLTLSERELVYEARNLARFRQTFFTEITGADGAGFLNLMVARQNILNEQGNIERINAQLDAISEFIRVQPPQATITLSALPAGFRWPPGLAPQLQYDAETKSVTWDGTMSGDQEQALRTASVDPALQVSIEDLIQNVRAQVPTLDILQLQSLLADSINRLRNLEVAYADAVDAYKIRLGLPTDFPLELDDTWLQSFRLIDPALMEIDTEATDLLKVRSRVSVTNPTSTELSLLLESACAKRRCDS
jgi:hypothetical protein